MFSFELFFEKVRKDFGWDRKFFGLRPGSQAQAWTPYNPITVGRYKNTCRILSRSIPDCLQISLWPLTKKMHVNVRFKQSLHLVVQLSAEPSFCVRLPQYPVKLPINLFTPTFLTFLAVWHHVESESTFLLCSDKSIIGRIGCELHTYQPHFPIPYYFNCTLPSCCSLEPRNSRCFTHHGSGPWECVSRCHIFIQRTSIVTVTGKDRTCDPQWPPICSPSDWWRLE